MSELKKTEKKPKVDSKKMLKDLGERKEKIFFRDRIKVEILKDTKYYRKGKVINPHQTFAKFLIKEGIAKELK